MEHLEVIDLCDEVTAQVQFFDVLEQLQVINALNTAIVQLDVCDIHYVVEAHIRIALSNELKCYLSHILQLFCSE